MIPEIDLPIYEFEQPSTKKKLKFRPYRVKEDKLLLMAKQANEDRKHPEEIYKAVKRVVQACCLEKTFNVDKLPLFDLEIFFLRLRGVSVNNVERFTARDPEDGKDYEHAINLNEVVVKFPEAKAQDTIKVNDSITIKMKYPTADLYNDETVVSNIKDEMLFNLVIECVDKVYNKDAVVKMTKEDLKKFIDNLDLKTYLGMREFLLNMPQIEHVVTYKNSLEHERQWIFRTFFDFFFFL